MAHHHFGGWTLCEFHWNQETIPRRHAIAGRKKFILECRFSRKRSRRVLSRNVVINHYLGLSGHPASSFTRSQVYNHKNEHRTVTMMVWKIIFLFQLCISRFQPLIFGGVSLFMISDVSDLWWFSDITPRCRSSPGCLLAAVRFQQQLGTFLHKFRILPHWARRSRKLWLCKQGFGKEVRGRWRTLWRGIAWRSLRCFCKKIWAAQLEMDGDVSLDTSAKDSQNILLHPTCNSWFQIYNCFLKGEYWFW